MLSLIRDPQHRLDLANGKADGRDRLQVVRELWNVGESKEVTQASD